MKIKNIKILAIETSCDETAAAILSSESGWPEILADIVSSQIDIHKKYGGVVPEIAARQHTENIMPVVDEAFKKAKILPREIDFIAVTAGPGLITSLLVGVETAKALSRAWDKPLLAVNHMYGHIAANFFNQKIEFPAAALVVSGGHTEIVLLKNYWQYEKIGQTVDDAVGEAFDKVAKLLGLGYPGGPIVSAHAAEFSGRPKLVLPRPMIKSNDFNFSFSGLKTAILYAVKKMSSSEKSERIAETCFAFQEAAVDVLVAKTIKAAKNHHAKSVLLAGGVAANKTLREALRQAAEKEGFLFNVPEFKLCTDNAAMVAVAAYFLAQKKKPSQDGWKKIKADPNWEL